MTAGTSPPDDLAIDVLIVGAGPTGLTLAAQLRTFGVHFRIIDRTPGPAHESRALAVQARTVEILDSLGIGEELVSRGNPSARLALHFGGAAVAKAELGGFAARDTRFPFILFVSQAETEALLGEHLLGAGVTIERGVELVSSAEESGEVRCLLRRRDGAEERIRARYIVGCDGAHSTVRKQAGIPFEGDAYLQDFMLGDVEADGPVERDTLHSFAVGGSVAMFFPLRTPTTWRVIAMRGGRAGRERADDGVAKDQSVSRSQLALEELQAVVDDATGAEVNLRDPAWLTHFRLHHRQARTYRQGRVFLAGDAAHIHSPVGAQGMNTGIQDAWNLGWKLALVALGKGRENLLDTYGAERWPVGRNLLRYTDRAFSVFTRMMAGSRLAAWIRRTIVARVLPRVFRSKWVRGRAFRFVSELAIGYRKSPAVLAAPQRRGARTRPGDRFPDARVIRGGRESYLHRELSGPRFHLVLCGDVKSWDGERIDRVQKRHDRLVDVHYLTRQEGTNALVDPAGEALAQLGLGRRDDAVQYLIRPDGYVGARCFGRDLSTVEGYLARWLPS
jgi:2-polyprenyl-6-methoxyphenol hydroxylase-like FAD-dependent oxidoreductase